MSKSPTAPAQPDKALYTLRDLALLLQFPPGAAFALRRTLRHLGYLKADGRPAKRYLGTLFQEKLKRNCSTAHHSTYRLFLTPQGVKALSPILARKLKKGAAVHGLH